MSLLLEPNEQVLQKCDARHDGLLGCLELTTKRLLFLPVDWTQDQLAHRISNIRKATRHRKNMTVYFFEGPMVSYEAAGVEEEKLLHRIADRLTHILKLQYNGEDSQSRLNQTLTESDSMLASYWRSSQRYHDPGAVVQEKDNEAHTALKTGNTRDSFASQRLASNLINPVLRSTVPSLTDKDETENIFDRCDHEQNINRHWAEAERDIKSKMQLPISSKQKTLKSGNKNVGHAAGHVNLKREQGQHFGLQQDHDDANELNPFQDFGNREVRGPQSEEVTSTGISVGARYDI